MAKHPRLREVPKKGKFYALVWTWQKYRLYRTKGAAQKALSAWKAWKERQGASVTGSVGSGVMLAGNEACSIHTYDAATRERIS